MDKMPSAMAIERAIFVLLNISYLLLFCFSVVRLARTRPAKIGITPRHPNQPRNSEVVVTRDWRGSRAAQISGATAIIIGCESLADRAGMMASGAAGRCDSAPRPRA